MSFVSRTSCGVTFQTLDPASFPYGGNTFEDEEELKLKYWRHLKPGDVVLDIGASWGGYTLPALAQGAIVHAFDPTESSETVIMRSAFENGTVDRLRFHRCALWDGTDYPEWMRREIFGTHYPVGSDPPILTLDSLTLTGVTHLKMDVEGAELGVVRGAIGTIARCRPFLFIEDHAGIYPGCTNENSSEPIRDLLRGLGYQVSWEPYFQRGYIVGTHPDHTP